MLAGKAGDNLIVKLTFEFSLEVLLFCDNLCSRKQFIISDQLLRSALSIGANVREAQNAESLADFIHKMKLACKESDESDYYLQLIQKAYNYKDTESLLTSITRIQKILNKIISTTRKKID